MVQASTVVPGVLLAFLVLAAPAASLAQEVGSAAPALVFDGVTVVDVVEGNRFPAQRVVVTGNRIAALGQASAVPLPVGARVVDARDKYLIPGLWDLHVHPQEYADIFFPLFLAQGVTGVRDAGSSIPLATLGQWKRELAAGTRPGPRLLVAGPSINEADSGQSVVEYQTPHQRHNITMPPALAGYVVDSLRAAGADMLKLYGMSRTMRLAMIAAAKRVGLPFGGHSAGMSGLDFSDSGATILDHHTWIPACGEGRGRELDKQRFAAEPCAAALRQLRRNGTWIPSGLGGGPGPVNLSRVPALSRRFMPHSWSTYARLYQGGQGDSVLAAIRHGAPWAFREVHSTAEWLAALQTDSAAWAQVVETRARQDSLRRFGAIPPVVVGTDARMNNYSNGRLDQRGLKLLFLYHDIVAGFVVGGMTPLEALQAATVNAARAVRVSDSLGTVAVGKVADLVLLDADPLADIWHTRLVRGVVANGRYYDRAALDGLLTAAEQAAARR